MQELRTRLTHFMIKDSIDLLRPFSISVPDTDHSTRDQEHKDRLEQTIIQKEHKPDGK